MSLWSEITSFRAFSIRHDFHLVNYGPLRCKICDKAECAVERGCLVIDKWVHTSGCQPDPIRTQYTSGPFTRVRLCVLLTRAISEKGFSLRLNMVNVQMRPPLGFESPNHIDIELKI